MKLDVKHEAGSNLVEAGQVYKREDPKSETLRFAPTTVIHSQLKGIMYIVCLCV